MKLVLASLVALSLGLTGCARSVSDGDKKVEATYGKLARITCFSGGKAIFDDFIANDHSYIRGSPSSGYPFVIKGHKFEISGDCQIEYNTTPPDGFKPIHRGEEQQINSSAHPSTN